MKSRMPPASLALSASGAESPVLDRDNEEEEVMSWWLSSGSDPLLGPDELDGLSPRRADTLTEADPDADGAFSGRFATGTGQFDLRSPELAAYTTDAPVTEVMSRRVTCVRPEMDAAEARGRILERGVSGAPVVDHWGRVVGMLSRSDLVEHEVTSEAGLRRVEDIMMPLVFSLPPEATVAQAAALMAYEGVHRIVIVDRGGYLVGLVSSLDVARWLGRRGGFPVGRTD